MIYTFISIRRSTTRNSCISLIENDLKMASAQVVATSVANNSLSQDSNHPNDHFQSRYVTPNHFKPFSYFCISSYIYTCLYPSSTGLSSTHITTRSQLAWLLNWSSTAPASQCSGFQSQFKPEYFRPAFSLLFEWRKKNCEEHTHSFINRE